MMNNANTHTYMQVVVNMGFTQMHAKKGMKVVR